jgi:hypothetical protein
MMAVAVKPGGTEFTFDAAVMLFDQAYFHVGGRSYDVAPDGRFAMITLAGGQAPSQDPRGIVVVQNWVEELKRLVLTP